MPAVLQADSWLTLLDYIDPIKFDGVWLVVESEGGFGRTARTREGYGRIDADGSLILTDDNGESHIFDRDEIYTVAI